MIRIQVRPASSTPVRIWRASGWNTSSWRDQSRGPAGPETMAYMASTTAPIAALASMSGPLGDDDVHALVALDEGRIDALGLAHHLDHREAPEDLLPDDLQL